MNLELRTTLSNTYLPRLIAPILKALREQLKENDELNAIEEVAGPVPDFPVAYERILRDGDGIWDNVNGGCLPEDLTMDARREEIA